MTWWLWLTAGFAVLGSVAAAVTFIGGRRWAREVQGLRDKLEAGRIDRRPDPSSMPSRYDARELEGLPAPVQRYFRAVLRDGQPVVTAVTIDIAGSFNMSSSGEQWKAFTSRQRVITRRPGFLWDAKIALVPGVTVRVVDCYIAGKGLLRATVQGLFKLAEQQGEGDIARGEFMRWFAEVLWYPTALLPSQGVRWEAVDDHSANAAVTDGPQSLTLLFRFNESDLIASFRAEARGGMVGDKLVMAPWEGIWSNYQTVDGMRVPFTGEVAWMRPEGRKPYFIGTVTALAFEFSAAGASPP
jgi:hypothetical protein